MLKIVVVRNQKLPRNRLAGERQGRAWAATVAILATAIALGSLGGATAATHNETRADMNHNVSPIKTISSGATIYNYKTYSFVARGGTTTVPSVATAVRLFLTDKSGKGGQVFVYPLGDPGNGTTLTWVGGQSTGGAMDMTIGASDKIEIQNQSGRQVSLAIQIVQYSDKIPVGQISTVNGNPGDVLRTDGQGSVYWGPETTKLVTRSATQTQDTTTSRRLNGFATCNSDEYPVAGGFSISDDSPPGELRVNEAYNNGWSVAIDFSVLTVRRTVTTYVTCALK